MKLQIIILLITLPSITLAQNITALHYKIYDSRTHKQIDLKAITAQLNKADVLFFGEEHDDSTGHVLEFELFKNISQQYPGHTALSMEMFQTDCQLVLDEYLGGLIREKNLQSDARPWPNYADYRPMIEWAKENHLPVIAANAPSRYTNMVSRSGLDALNELSAQAKVFLPPMPIDTATGAYYNKFIKIMGGHEAMGGMQIYQSQNLWDATMAWSIASFLKIREGFKVLQLNGGFHSEEKLGIVAQLKKYAPQTKAITIGAYADKNFTSPDWAKYEHMADYIILTGPAAIPADN